MKIRQNSIYWAYLPKNNIPDDGHKATGVLKYGIYPIFSFEFQNK